MPRLAAALTHTELAVQHVSDDAPRPHAASLDVVAAAAIELAAGRPVDVRGFTPLQWIHLLRALPLDAPPRPVAAILADLDRAHHLTASSNAELLAEWLRIAALHDYQPARARTRTFLLAVGRRKYLTPIYAALRASDDGAGFAAEVYAAARPGYHAVTRRTLDALLGWPAPGRVAPGE